MEGMDLGTDMRMGYGWTKLDRQPTNRLRQPGACSVCSDIMRVKRVAAMEKGKGRWTTTTTSSNNTGKGRTRRIAWMKAPMCFPIIPPSLSLPPTPSPSSSNLLTFFCQSAIVCPRMDTWLSPHTHTHTHTIIFVFLAFFLSPRFLLYLFSHPLNSICSCCCYLA